MADKIEPRPIAIPPKEVCRLLRYPGGLVIEGVTIGAGAGGYCFRVSGSFPWVL
jgi:hypothetical protein